MRGLTANYSARLASATPAWPTSVSACISRRGSLRVTAIAGTRSGRRSPVGLWPRRPQPSERHATSAASLRLRAAEYYRQAFFWHRDNLDSKELTTAYRASVDAFRSALPALSRPGRVVEGDTPGYLFAPPGAGPFPTILHIGGYDNTAEELYASVYPALDRGWAFVGLDGPGQGSVLYDRRVPQRPNWENVVPGMLDLVTGLPQVDSRRIVLVGRSFGGLLAPRGAAGTPRLAALIVDPGQYDMAAGMTGRLGELWRHVDDSAAETLRRMPPEVHAGWRAAFDHYIFGPDAPLRESHTAGTARRSGRDHPRACATYPRPAPWACQKLTVRSLLGGFQYSTSAPCSTSRHGVSRRAGRF